MQTSEQILELNNCIINEFDNNVDRRNNIWKSVYY
jgi:hypothetical protein